MKIIFIGTVDFSLEMLHILIRSKSGVVGVVTKKQSSQNADFADLSSACRKADIPIYYAVDVNEPAAIRWISSFEPDIIFCFGLSQILADEVLKIAPQGVIGYHPAALPHNRGRHPLIWALALGLKKTASTFFFMDHGADSGDIISQKPVTITSQDNAGSLYRKIVKTAGGQLKLLVQQLKKSTIVRRKQDHRKSTYWRKRSKEDGQIDFRMSVQAIDCLVRALAKPYPGAHVVFRGEDIKIWRVKRANSGAPDAEPGKILDVRNNLILVKCFDKALWLIEHEFKHLPAKGEYIR